MIEFFTGFFLLTGALLMLIAGLGLLRMPDLPTRMHASSKAGALGAGMMVASVAIYFDDGGVIARAIATIVFILMTAPVAAHLIGRAGYFVGVPLWDRTLKDELKGRYNRGQHTLAGRGEEKSP